MNPMLLRLLATLGPRAASLMGLSGGAGAALNSMSGTSQGDILTDPGLLADIKSKTTPQNTGASGSWSLSPNARVADAFGAMGSPMQSFGVPLPQPRPLNASMAQAPEAMQGVPLPQARPDTAPQMSFFQRNALMQKDPLTGDFLDPQAAASAQNSQAYANNGSDLISKFLNYFHQKGVG